MIYYFVTILSLLLATATHAKAFNTDSFDLSNGAHAVFYQAMDVPMLEIHVAFKAGSAYDGQQYGLSKLTTALLDQGSQHMTATQISDAFLASGAQYHYDVGRDKITLILKTLTEEKAKNLAIQTFSTVINEPSFKFDNFNQKKAQQLAAIARQQESPESVANRLFYENLYENHPYAHPIYGTPATLKRITQRQVQDFYNHYMIGKEAVIVLVGAITPEEAHQLAETLVGKRPAGKPIEALPKASPLLSEKTIQQSYPSTQTMLRIGQLGIGINDPDFFPLMVGNYILGSPNLVSRLGIEVREKRGLTYGVSSQFIPMPGIGPFIISLSTRNKEATNAASVSEAVLKDFLQTGPSEEELKAAKHYLIGSFPLSLAGNSNIAAILLHLSFYHLPEDYLNTYVSRIKAVNQQDVKTAFERHIQIDKLLHIRVGQT